MEMNFNIDRAEAQLILDALNIEIERLVSIPRYGRAHQMCELRDKLQLKLENHHD